MDRHITSTLNENEGTLHLHATLTYKKSILATPFWPSLELQLLCIVGFMRGKKKFFDWKTNKIRKAIFNENNGRYIVLILSIKIAIATQKGIYLHVFYMTVAFINRTTLTGRKMHAQHFHSGAWCRMNLVRLFMPLSLKIYAYLGICIRFCIKAQETWDFCSYVNNWI